MPRRLESMPSTQQIVDPATGIINSEWYDFLEEVVFGRSENSLGTLLSGVNTAKAEVSGIIEGASEQAEEGLASDFTVTADATNAVGNGTGTVNTSAVTISVSGGTAPYSIAWANVGLSNFTANSVSSLSADGDFSATFSRNVDVGESYSGIAQLTVTDSAGSPQTAQININLNVFDLSLSSPDGIGGRF